MNTTFNQNLDATRKKLAEKYKKTADELSADLRRLEAVSPDTAYRQGFNLEALRRAQHAAEEDKVFLSGQGVKGVLILGISALNPDKAEAFISACAGWKSHVNSVLELLDGELGEIRLNKAVTCWVIDLASPRREIIFAWSTGPGGQRLVGPKLNTTNGAAHWCGVITESVPLNREASPATVAFLERATQCFIENKMTPRQWERVENARKQAESERHGLVVRAAIAAGETDGVVVYVGCGYNPTRGEAYIQAAEEIAGTTGPVPENLATLVREKIAAIKRAAEEARLMAELEAEQARLTEEKAKAEDEAKRQEEIKTACRAAGVSPEQWRDMTAKQQRLALHRARLAGKV
jgi:hypothetical protein